MPVANESKFSTTLLRIELPKSLYESLSTQAEESGKDIEDLITSRLTEFKDQNTFKGRMLKVSPEERQSLEKVFGRSFKDGSELTRYLLSAYTLRVGDVKVNISSEVARRIKERAIRRNFEDYLSEIITKQLEHYVGLR